jgi:peptidoglycan/LPS O-acetylase OafA/YrhL
MLRVGGRRIAALDGLRGVAIALVLARHGFGLPGGGIVGVQLFFVLSGFLITSLLLEERAATGRVSLSGFYRRRAARLLPALVVFLTCYVLFATATFNTEHLREARVGALTTLLYVNNLSTLASWPNSVELGPMWTLSTEEQFYLLWPLVLIALLAIRPRIPRWLWMSTTVAALVALVVYRTLAWHRYGIRIYSFPLTWVDGLCGGALLAAPSIQRAVARYNWRLVGGVAVAVLAAATLVPNLKSDTATYVIGVSAISALGVAFVAAAVSSDWRWLSWLPLVWLGRISYAAYLWNEFAYSAARNVLPLRVRGAGAVLAIAGTLVVAQLSMMFVERPLLRRFGGRREVQMTAGAFPQSATSSGRRRLGANSRRK